MEDLCICKATLSEYDQIATFVFNSNRLLTSYSIDNTEVLDLIHQQLDNPTTNEFTYIIKDPTGQIVALCTFYNTLFRSRYGFARFMIMNRKEAAEILHSFIHIAFFDLNYNKINVHLSGDDLSLYDLLTAQEFRLEVQLREHIMKGGQWVDLLQFGLVRSDSLLTIGENQDIKNSHCFIKTDIDSQLSINITPEKYLLCGEKVELTMINEDDLNQISTFIANSNADSFCSISAVGPRNRHSIDWMANKKNDYLGLTGDFLFAIRRKNEKEVIGTIIADTIDLINSNLMLGIDIYRACDRNQGYGSEAMLLMTDFCFLELNVHRVYFGCFSYNKIAIALYKRLGFIQEGINRSFLYRNGCFYDEIVFGVTKSEWMNLRNYIVKFE